MVPRHLVTLVYGFIADAGRGGLAGLPVVPDADLVADDEVGSEGTVWPPAMLQKLASSTYTTMQRLAVVMDYLAERPGVPVSTSELVEHLDMARTQLKSVWVKLSPHLEKHYEAGIGWPVSAKWGPFIQQPSQETYYWISAAQAERWKAVRQGH